MGGTDVDEELVKQLKVLVREVITEQLGEQTGEQGLPEGRAPRPLEIGRDTSGFAVIGGTNVDYEVFDTGKPGDKVMFRQLMTSEESPNLAFGFLDIEESSFDWFLGYDEVDYILRGTWEITIDGTKYVGHAGDTMFIPKNTAVTFGSPDHATVFYTAYPANWEELCEEQ
ncbi:MAG: cupin domain-containing protein [Coriobacteriales bacterium]|jgi:ethanolamine utilization protein EutQ|nr:cupin domain-containing protein [Coriobacteriales bacterium]